MDIITAQLGVSENSVTEPVGERHHRAGVATPWKRTGGSAISSA